MQVTTVSQQDQAHAEQTAAQAGQILRDGGLVVFPTETVYGIAASAASEQGLAALRAFKERPSEQPFTIHIPDADAAGQYVDTSWPPLKRLIDKVFPGPVTLVADVSQEVIDRSLSGLGLAADDAGRLYHEGTVGLRCPDSPTAQRVLAAAGVPVVASSANRRGGQAPLDAQEAADAVADAAGLVIDGGRCRYAKPSTIVRVRQIDGRSRVSVEREGVYDERTIRRMMRWTALMVCSGNTCRSPMAAALAQQMLSEARSIPVEDLETSGIRVVSAGTSAGKGSPASPEAVEAMQRLGLDLSDHRSEPLTAQLIQEADAVFCMTEAHAKTVLRAVPSAEAKVFPLDPSHDVEDPIGGSLTTYLRCAEMIRRRLRHHLTEQHQV